jgi:hypothetical protein
MGATSESGSEYPVRKLENEGFEGFSVCSICDGQDGIPFESNIHFTTPLIGSNVVFPVDKRKCLAVSNSSLLRPRFHSSVCHAWQVISSLD